MKTRQNDNKLIALSLTGVAFILALFGSASFDRFSIALLLGVPALIAASIYFLVMVSFRQKNENSNLIKGLSVLITLSLVVSTFAAMKSLGYSPLNDNWGDRFIYENLATAAGFTSIALILILSATQNDIYWFMRKKSVRMDERQIKQRQQIFETSYKIAVILALAAAWLFSNIMYKIPEIIANNFNSVPGHLFWLPFNLALTLFALPLIIASWQNNPIKLLKK